MKNSIFPRPDATWHRFWSSQCAPECSRAPFLTFQDALRDSLGAPGARRGRPKTLPRRSHDAFGTRLDPTVRPESVPGAILSRFWVPRGVSGDRFSMDFRDDFRFILRASWPANGITLDGQAHRQTHAAKQNHSTERERERVTHTAGRSSLWWW